MRNPSGSRSSGSGSGSVNNIDFDFIKKVFSLEMPNPNPQFPQTFFNLIPTVDNNIPRSDFFVKDVLIQKLHLDYMERFSILTSIEENNSIILLSNENKLFTGALILQSLCSIYFIDINAFDSETSRLFFDMILLLCRILPNEKDLISQAFLLVYQRVVKGYQIIELLPSIIQTSKLLVITKIQFLELHMKALESVVVFWTKKTLPSLAKIIIQFIDIVEECFLSSSFLSIGDSFMNKIFDCLDHSDSCFTQNNAPSDNQFLVLKLLAFCIDVEYISQISYIRFPNIIYQCSKIPDIFLNHLGGSSQSYIESIDFGSLSSQFDLVALLENLAHPVFFVFTYLKQVKYPALLITRLFELAESMSNNYIIILVLLLESFEINILKEVLSFSFFQKLFNLVFFSNGFSVFHTTNFMPLIAFRSVLLDLFLRCLSFLPHSEMFEQYTLVVKSLHQSPCLLIELFFHSEKILLFFLKAPSYSNMVLSLIGEICDCLWNETELIPDNSSEFLRTVFYRIIHSVSHSSTNWDISFFIGHPFYSHLIQIFDVEYLSLLVKSILEVIIPNLSYKRDPLQFASMFSFLFKRLNEISFQLDSKSDLCVLFIEMIFNIIERSERKIVIQIIGMDIFKPLFPLIFKSLSNRVISRVIKLLGFLSSYTTLSLTLADFYHLSNYLLSITMDRDIFTTILQLLFFGQINCINCFNAHPLIYNILCSQFNYEFANILSTSIHNSVSLRYQCLNIGIPTYLLRILSNECNDSIIDQYFSIIESIIFTICDSRTIAQIAEMLSANANGITKYISRLYQFLMLMTTNGYSESLSVIEMDHRNHGIELDEVKPLVFPNVLTIAFYLRIQHLSEDSNIRLVSFSNQSDYLYIDLYSSFILICSSYYSESINIPLSVKNDVWNNMVFEFSAIGKVSIIINEQKITSSAVDYCEWSSSFPKCSILNGGNGVFVYQFKNFALMSHTLVNKSYHNWMEMIKKDIYIKDQCYNVCLLANRYEGCFLINEANMSRYRFQGFPIPARKSLFGIFEDTNSIDHFVFSIKLLNNHSLSTGFLSEFIDVLFCLMSCSQKICTRFGEIDGFAVLLNNLSTLSSINLEHKDFVKITQIGHSLHDEKLYISFFTNLIFNYSIWKKTPLDVQKEVFSFWKSVTALKASLIRVSMPVVCITSIIFDIYNAQALTDDVLGSLCTVFANSIKDGVSSSELELLLILLFHIRSNSNAFKQVFFSLMCMCSHDYFPKLIRSNWLFHCGDKQVISMLFSKVFPFDSIIALDMISVFISSIESLSECHKHYAFCQFRSWLVNIECCDRYEQILNMKKSWKITLDMLFPLLCFSLFIENDMISPFIIFLSTVIDHFQIVLSNSHVYVVCLLSLKCQVGIYEYLATIFTIHPQVLSKAYHHYYSIIKEFEIDLFKMLNEITKLCIVVSFSSIKKELFNEFLDVYVTYFCFHDSSLFNATRSIKPLDFQKIKSSGYQFKNSTRYCFGLNIINGIWVDSKLVLLLADFVLSNSLSMNRFIVPFSFLLSKSVPYNERAIDLIDLYFCKYGNSVNWSVLLSQLAKSLRFNTSGSFFINNQTGLFIKSSMFLSSYNYLELFVKQAKLFSETVEQEFFQKSLNDDKVTSINIDEIIKSNDIVLSNRLKLATLANKRLELAVNHDVRNIKERNGEYFDFFFRPILSIHNGCKPPRIILGITNSLWKSNCVMHKFNKEINGMLYINRDSFVFANSQKTRSIYSRNIFAIFHGPKDGSIQIFTRSHECYLFSIGTETTHDIIQKFLAMNLRKPVFIQKDAFPNSDVSDIISQWRDNKISTWSFLIWINLLSGRSFLSIKHYPVFPCISKVYESLVFQPISKQYCSIKPFSQIDISIKFPPSVPCLPVLYYLANEHCDSIPFNQIMIHRQSLESFPILNWFFSVFGMSLPSKKEHQFFTLQGTETHFNDIIEPFVLVWLDKKNKDTHFYVLTSEQKILRLSSTSKNQIAVSSYLPLSEKLILTDNDKIVFSNTNSRSLMYYDMKSVSFLENDVSFSGFISTISISENFVFSCNSDGAHNLYDLSSGYQILSTWKHNSEIIACSSISNTMGIAISVGYNGVMNYLVVPTLRIIRSVFTKLIPKKCYLIEGLGIILLHGYKDGNDILKTFTVNGNEICSICLPFYVQSIVVFEKMVHEEHFLLLTDNNDVILCNSINLQIGNTLYHSEEKIVFFGITNDFCIYIINDLGHVILIN